jgi:CYTH domain-containing protein
VLEGALETALDDASREKSARLRQLALAGDRSTLDRERRRDERLGLVTLAARARNRRDELYNEFEKQWLRGRATELLREVQGFAESIGPPEERSDVREERSDVRGERNDVRGERTGIPGTLPIECERKDLLSALPIRALAAPSVEIEQGWLPGKTLRERIRRTSDQDGDRYFRTVKLGSGVERIEIEEETTAEIFAAMWPLTRGCRISKRRYLVPDGDLVWEVDQFADRDLVLAEVELESGEQEVSLPEWLQPSVVREVTEDPAYLNLSLAMQAA